MPFFAEAFLQTASKMSGQTTTRHPMPKAHSLLAVLSLLTASLCQAQTGTFVDKWGANDLRVVSYNIFNDAIFPPSDDPFNDVPERFRRVVNALQPDVLAVQEIRDFTASETAALLDSVAPLPGGANWHAHKNSDNVILSRFPFLLTTSQAGHADALIDLPDADYAQDFFVLNDHLPCCSNEVDRQFEADRIVRWIDDARSPGGSITLPDETPFVLLGDFNIVGSGQPLDTLVTGDIINTFIGPDSPPDWDGTPLTDSRPLHNASGPNDYTWRNDTSRFPPGRLDYILYSDSVVETANSFVLNTTILSASERLATGLQSNDVLINAGSGFFDHLPVVVDPSHSTGDARYVAPMAKAALVAGADGLLVEVHAEPERALSDGHQALTPAAFAQLSAELQQLAPLVGRRWQYGNRAAAGVEGVERRPDPTIQSFDDEVIAP